MPCPFCEQSKTVVDLRLDIPGDTPRGEEMTLLEEYIRTWFPDIQGYFEQRPWKCPACSSHWTFNIQAGNIDPRDSSMGTDWFQIHCTRMDKTE